MLALKAFAYGRRRLLPLKNKYSRLNRQLIKLILKKLPPMFKKTDSFVCNGKLMLLYINTHGRTKQLIFWIKAVKMNKTTEKTSLKR